MLERSLHAEGFRVDSAPDGGIALAIAERAAPDLVILDIGMPGLDGLAVCRRLRAVGMTGGILMLTARDAVSDRVNGLEAGADDYLVKPFALEELLARLHALHRRATPDGDGAVLRFADLTLDPRSLEVRRGGEPIELRRMQFLLLELFMLNPRQVLTRSQIYDRVWGYDFGPTSNSLDVQLGQLRRRLGEPRLIHTIRGLGYILREP